MDRSRPEPRPRRRAHRRASAPLVLVLAAVLTAGSVRASNDLGRDEDPVVLTGADVPALVGAMPGDLVAFRRENGAWVRIPVQVDPRVLTTFAAIYGDPVPYPGLDEPILTYADPGTHVGPDPDPALDDDDELVFLAGDAGRESAPSGAYPPGVGTDARVEVVLSHPDGGVEARAYLFVHDGTLPPGPPTPGVLYDFDLLAGTYPDDYDVLDGPNPEDSTVVAPDYTVHFSDRWIRDGTAVTAPGATGVDLLDRHKTMFEPGDCRRTEDTFSDGEGAFIVNRGGPVRALRGYVGANSGPTSHRIHLFYPSREELRIVVRVHTIEGAVDFFDHAPAAVGATYADSRNPAEVPVDGVPDAVVAGDLRWSRIAGPQGTIARVVRVDTDIPGFAGTSYYSDDDTPETVQCTGDAFEYGASGYRIDQRIPNTDPANGDAYRLEVLRVIDYAGPGGGNAVAVALAEAVDRPLIVEVRSNGGGSTTCSDPDQDGHVVCTDGCTPAAGDLCGECAPLDGQTYPGAPEVCDGRDRDCSGIADDPACAAYDLDGNGRVDGGDLAFVGRAFGNAAADPTGSWWQPADLDRDDDVDGDDVALLAAVWARACGGDGVLICSTER